MIKAEFKSYGSYTTDSVSQWDLNQKLTISGLDIDVAPVLAFSCFGMYESIIVQSKLSDGVITCDVPNAILQFGKNLNVDLCSETGGQYKAFEKMIIPVNRRKKPSDYLFTDNVPLSTAESIKADLEKEINSNKTYTDKVKAELKNDNKTLNGRIDTILTGTVNTTKLVTVHSATIRNNSASDLTFKISSKDNETLKSIKDKSPTVIDTNVIARALDGVAINGASIPSSYNVESTNDEYVITVYSGSSSVVGQYVFMAVATIAYKDTATDISSAELKDIRTGANGTTYPTAGDAVRGQINDLKKELDDSNLDENVSQIQKNMIDISQLKESKISKPSIDGTVGQVLTKDENGEFVWKDVLTELDDDSVDLSKLKNKYLIVEEGVTGTNVIDESLLIYKMSDDRNLSPGYLSTTVADDTLVPQNGTYTSSFIKVEPNKTYYINREEHKDYEGIKLYNSDKTPIQFIQLRNIEQGFADKEKVSPQRTFTTPENCSYMRIDGNEKYMDIIYVATDYPKKVIYNKNYYLNKSYIKESSIKTQKIVWSPTPDNTYNGWVSSIDGGVSGSGKDQSTGFIIVRPNTRYTKNPKSSGSVNKQDVAFYDYSKTFISGIQLQVGEFEFTTPDNCQYVRFDMLATHKDTEYLEVVYDEDSNDKELVTSVKSLPTLYMSGDVTDMSKVNEKFVRFKYVDGTTIKRGYNTIKWQGDSSLSYPKKNYTIKLYCDKNKKCKQPLDFGWGKQNKYVLKANYIDHSHARNIVSARLWSQIVNSRGTYSYTNVKDTPNNGAIDGMPIIVYLNGTYLGLYTLNIPKDKWMFGMDDGISTQAVLGSENYVEGCFRSSSNPLNGWSAEFPDELPTEIQTSFKTAYNFVTNNTGADFKSGLSNYFDVASLIDYYIFGYVICHLDGFGKNQLLATYDGIHWSMMAYDMDSTFGLFWNGSKFVSTDYRCQEDYQSVVDGPSGTNGNELFNKLKDNFKAEIYERYTELREDVLSLDNIKFEFEKFINSITSKEYVNDIKTNTGVPQKDVNHLKQIEEYIETRLPYVDTKMKELNG